MHDEFWVENEDVKLFCREFGKGPLVLLIHGSCLDGSFFDECAKYIAKKTRVLTYDRRGYGHSSRPKKNDYSINAQINDIIQILSIYNEPTYVIAHSFGAVIALHALKTYPELFHGALLYEPFSADLLPSTHPALEKIMSMQKCIASNQYARAMLLFCDLIGQQELLNTKAYDAEITEKNFMTFIKYEFSETFSDPAPNSFYCNIPIVLGSGTDNAGNHFDISVRECSKLFDTDIIKFPGGHNSPCCFPREFSDIVLSILRHL